MFRNMAEATTFTIRYCFRFPDQTEKVFDVKLDSQTGALIQPKRESYPAWTRLGLHQCRHCPLKKEEHPQCPVAASLVDVVDFFYDSHSVKKVDVTVQTQHRETQRKDMLLFPAISSLIGIHMASSGCPHLNKLRPMVLHHLPFADSNETIYRALSMYVLAQYFRRKKGLTPDWELTGLSEIYTNINILNRDFSHRLANESDKEASRNAITSLDCFAQMIEFSITEEMLEELELQFSGYLSE